MVAMLCEAGHTETSILVKNGEQKKKPDTKFPPCSPPPPGVMKQSVIKHNTYVVELLSKRAPLYSTKYGVPFPII